NARAARDLVLAASSGRGVLRYVPQRLDEIIGVPGQRRQLGDTVAVHNLGDPRTLGVDLGGSLADNFDGGFGAGRTQLEVDHRAHAGCDFKSLLGLAKSSLRNLE